MSDDTGKLVGEVAASGEDVPSPDASAALPPEEVAKESESPAVEQPSVDEVTAATEQPPEDRPAAETTPGSEYEEQASAEDSEEDSDDDDVEMVARPTSFAPMTKEVDPEHQEPKPADESIEMNWYILKVQSNRERSVADALRRKIAIEGLEKYFDDVMVPTEKVTEFKAGKKKVVERKLYPGYIVVHMHINDDTWFAVRDTSGIGDFTGSAGKPTPMLAHEVARIVQSEEEETDEAPKLNISFKLGDRVKIKEGTFESFEGDVNAIDEQSGRITVMINIFGRSTPVELEYWQAEQT